MKYLINERQYKLITEEQEILHIPSLDVFGDWDALQKFLERRGNPLFSIGGDLDLRNTNIESLGNLTSVGENLDLNGCKNLTSFGNLTSVGGYLDLEGTNIKSLGNLTSVGGDLVLYGTKIKSLGNLTSVGGYLSLDNCKNLTSLGNLTSVGEYLSLPNTPIKSLGNLTSVGGHLDLANTPISKKYSEKEIRDMVDIGGYIFYRL